MERKEALRLAYNRLYPTHLLGGEPPDTGNTRILADIILDLAPKSYKLYRFDFVKSESIPFVKAWKRGYTVVFAAEEGPDEQIELLARKHLGHYAESPETWTIEDKTILGLHRGHVVYTGEEKRTGGCGGPL